MQRVFFACLMTLVVATGIAAQTPPPDYKGPVDTRTSTDRAVPKQISGGVLNGKATSLPKPPYPAAAREVGASGPVTVQVLIDENGDVISAKAITGHELLRPAAEEAARGAKFSPTTLQGNPVKVAGVITYNFVGPLYLAKLGSVLAYATHSGAFGRNDSPAYLASRMPADWMQEKEILNSLTFEELPAVVANADPAKTAVEPTKPDSRDRRAKTSERYTIKGDINFSAATASNDRARKLDAKSIESVRTLMTLIETRASVRPSAVWTYELGQAIGILLADIEDQSRLASNVARIEALVERAPANVFPTSSDRLREFVDFAKTAPATDNVRHQIAARAEILANLPY